MVLLGLTRHCLSGTGISENILSVHLNFSSDLFTFRSIARPEETREKCGTRVAKNWAQKIVRSRKEAKKIGKKIIY